MDKKILHKNKKAFFDYEIIDSFEAGIELKGGEVKSIKEAQCNLKGAHVIIHNGQMSVKGMHIAQYKFDQNIIGAFRERKIFLHKKTILRLEQKLKETGYTIIPTEVYQKANLVKITVALAK